jgi:hypothetical protein
MERCSRSQPDGQHGVSGQALGRRETRFPALPLSRERQWTVRSAPAQRHPVGRVFRDQPDLNTMTRLTAGEPYAGSDPDRPVGHYEHRHVPDGIAIA